MSDKELISEARQWEREYEGCAVGECCGELADALESVRAERDAALAAIERVRAIHVRHKDTHKRDPSVINGNWFCCGAVQLGAVDPYACIACYSPEWPCPTVAALDGAPEPEWKVQYGRRNRETGTLHWLTEDPRDDWWHENQDRYEHVKRYTSPPLPVEGEGNDA